MVAVTKTRQEAERVIRDPDFAKRLSQACDGHSHCPPLHSGRLTWIERELKARFDLDVSTETVRKWLSGEAKPRPDKLANLAQLLEVDVGWLSLGIQADLLVRERKARNAMADGAVNTVAGLIQMDGGRVAFPEEAGSIDIHAIIRGVKYDLHVCLGEREGRLLRFSVPNDYAKMVVLGVVRTGFSLQVFEVEPELIAAGERRGGSIEVTASEGKLRKVETFTARL